MCRCFCASTSRFKLTNSKWELTLCPALYKMLGLQDRPVCCPCPVAFEKEPTCEEYAKQSNNRKLEINGLSIWGLRLVNDSKWVCPGVVPLKPVEQLLSSAQTLSSFSSLSFSQWLSYSWLQNCCWVSRHNIYILCRKYRGVLEVGGCLHQVSKRLPRNHQLITHWADMVHITAWGSEHFYLPGHDEICLVLGPNWQAKKWFQMNPQV